MKHVSKIRIFSIPDGEAPEWVRKEWVGLELPVADPPEDIFQFPLSVRATNILSGSPVDEEEQDGFYLVDYKQALAALLQKSTEAVQWWLCNFQSTHLLFGKKSCEAIG